MSRTNLPAFWLYTALLLSMPLAGSAQNQSKTQLPEKAANGVVLTSELVKTGLFLISGGGGNTLLRFSASGLILVNGKLPGNYRLLMAQVRKISRISDLPVRALIVTDHHEEHTGTNAQFLAAGVGIIAHEQVASLLTRSDASDRAAALPTVTYAKEYKLRMGGVEAQLMHFGKAHTNGDTVVYFPNLRVVAVGDLFAANPDPDFLSGGSLVTWGPALGEVLKLDFDVVVPGTGPMVGRADLEAFKTKIDTLVSRASELIKEGVPKDRLMAQLKTDDLGWRFDIADERLDRFYAELSHLK